MNAATFAVANEAGLRLAGFLFVLLVLVFAQWRWPARHDGQPAPRHLSNLGLVALGTLVLRLAFPLLAVGLATKVARDDGGLLGMVDAPAWLEFTLAVLVLDLAIYWQHRLHHVIPLLWRLHRVHHSDIAFDVTTGVRFHPLEIAVSMSIKLGLVWLLGPPPAAVLTFELLLSLGSLFTHADFALPAGLDRRLRTLLVTPSMHRVHHSIRRDETDSNYGFHLALWDRLFGSYRAAPMQSEHSMPIGLPAFREPHQQRLVALLLQPLKDVPRA